MPLDVGERGDASRGAHVFEVGHDEPAQRVGVGELGDAQRGVELAAVAVVRQEAVEAAERVREREVRRARRELAAVDRDARALRRREHRDGFQNRDALARRREPAREVLRSEQVEQNVHLGRRDVCERLGREQQCG